MDCVWFYNAYYYPSDHGKVNEDLLGEESLIGKINIRDGIQVLFDDLFPIQSETLYMTYRTLIAGKDDF